MKKIITISREFGAAGTTIGRMVADRLGYDLWNKAIPLTAQADSNVNISDLVEFDEKVPVNYSFGQSLFEFSNRQLSDRIFEAQTEVIRTMGEKGRCVIVGRNANYILREYEGLLRVFLCADTKWRLDHMEELNPEYSSENMDRRLKQIDRVREKYCMYYTHTELHDARNYDVCLNVSSLGIENTAEILYRIAAE